MPSIDQILRPNAPIRLEFANNQGAKITAQSRINRFDGADLVLDAPNPLYILNDLAINQDLALICKYKDDPKDFVFFVKFIKTMDTDPPEMVVSKPDDFALGRKAFRCEVTNPFGYYNGRNEYKEGMIVNLSTTGLLATIKPDDSLRIGMDLTLKLQLSTKTNPMLLVGKIVRLENAENESLIALVFSYLPNNIHDAIGRFLSDAQGSLIRKAKQKKVAFIKLHHD